MPVNGSTWIIFYWNTTTGIILAPMCLWQGKMWKSNVKNIFHIPLWPVGVKSNYVILRGVSWKRHYLIQCWVIVNLTLSENVIEITNFSLVKMHLNISFVKWQPFVQRGNELFSLGDTVYFSKLNWNLCIQSNYTHWWERLHCSLTNSLPIPFHWSYILFKNDNISWNLISYWMLSKSV